MTMIDESVLSKALQSCANEFEVSAVAMSRIIGVARDESDRHESRGFSTFWRHRSKGRTMLVAAALTIVVAAIALPLARGEVGVPRVSAQQQIPFGTDLQGSVKASSTGSADHGATSLSPSLGLWSSRIVGTNTAGKSSQSLKIESSGTVGLTVANGQVQASLTRLGMLAARVGGFVESTQAVASAQKSANYSNATIVLQVPQRVFSTLVTQVQQVGHASSINVQSKDVTSQYVGLEARLTALESSRDQYLTIMTRATTIGDILAVQAQLNTLQSQIEQLQGQMNLLNNEITYGSLTVQLTETSHVVSSTRSSGPAKAARESVAGFVAGVEWLIRIVGPALFVVLLLGALYGGARFARRALRRRGI